jgi:hypothetical protein
VVIAHHANPNYLRKLFSAHPQIGLFAQFLRYAQKIILLRRINPRNINYMPVVIFFTCLPSSPEGYAGHVILNKNPISGWTLFRVSSLRII